MKQTPKPLNPNKPRNLSDVQFRYFPPGKGGYAFHELQMTPKELDPEYKTRTVIGTIKWHPRTGDVNWVRTHQDYRGLGVATTMWEKAKKLSADTGIKEPQHSKHRTDEGNKWAKSVGGKMPRRAPYETW